MYIIYSLRYPDLEYPDLRSNHRDQEYLLLDFDHRRSTIKTLDGKGLINYV